MNRREIRQLFRLPSGRYLPAGLNIWQKLWWKFVPGVSFKVKWPRGEIIVNHEDPRWVDLGGAVWVNLGFSADPNDHYRCFLEKHVGQQGWHWNWGLADKDVIDDMLTIKIIKCRASWASYFAMRWS